MAKGKKSFDEARTDYGNEQDIQPFSDYDDEIFELLDAAKVEADTLPIMSIWADPTQPRNIIPREIRGNWTGNPATMPEILNNWIEAIYDSGVDLPIENILLGKPGSDKTNSLPREDQPPIVQKFIPILTLAAQIRDVGLKQRIGVIAVGKTEYRIIYGERRWTAFHLLRMMLGDGYTSIPAQIAKVTEWELAKIQTAENMHHDPLNAISKARNFAKLLIMARKATQDPPYDSWSSLVVDGGCNRPYFAQVADGKLHRIPKGMGEELERTLNISVEQMGQYRALLRLTGDYDIDNKLWDMGDERDWAEGFMRAISELELPTIRKIFEEAEDPEEMLREAVSAMRAEKKSQNIPTIVGISGNATPEEATPKSPFGPAIQVGTGTGTASQFDFKYGDEVLTADGKGEIITIVGDTAVVKLHDSNRSVRYGMRNLQHAPKTQSWFNKTVQNVSGLIGIVIADFGSDCEVEYADGGRGRIEKHYLSEVSREEWNAEVQRYREQVRLAALSGNWLNKFVRTYQGVGQVIRNIDARYVRVRFPDGDELDMEKASLPFVDKSEWDEAVEALDIPDGSDEDDEQEEDAAPALKFKVNELVWVRQGMGQVEGKVRYVKPDEDKPYGVFLADSQSTHYYAEWQLAYTRDAAPSAGKALSLKDVSTRVTDKIRELMPKAFDGMPTAGWLNFHRAIMEKYGLNHHITLAFYTGGKHIAIGEDANKFAQAMTTVKHPYTKGVLNGTPYCYVDWKGIMDVLDKTGAHYIKYRNPDQMERHFDRWMEAVLGLRDSDNANSLPPATPAKNEWVGKPAIFTNFSGEKTPVFIQEQMADGRLRATTNDGKQIYVLPQLLAAVPTDSTTLSEFFNPDEGHDHSDLLNRRVKLNTGDVGTVTRVSGNLVSLQFTEFTSGSALIEHIIEVLEDNYAEETKAITDVETQALLRHIGHLTGREETVLRLINLTRQNAIQAQAEGKLYNDLELIRNSIKSGFAELLEHVEVILTGVMQEAEKAVK